MGMDPDSKSRLHLLRQGTLKRGCALELCFLFEAGNKISNLDYQNQKDFADLIVGITSVDSVNPARLCAASYTRSVIPAVTEGPGLTTNRTAFLNKVQALPRPRWSRSVDVRAPLKYALNILNGARKTPQRRRLIQQRRRRHMMRSDRSWNMGGSHNAGKIVLFAKSRKLFPRAIRKTKRRLRVLKNNGGSICAVALDHRAKAPLEFLTSDAGRVFELDHFFDIAEVVVATVANVCGMPCEGADRERNKDVCPQDQGLNKKEGEGKTTTGTVPGSDNTNPTAHTPTVADSSSGRGSTSSQT